MSWQPPTAKPLTLAGPAGALEALLEDPAVARANNSGPVAFGVICHPHPLGGGAMTNKVVHTVARSMQRCGAPTVRFNFRGVGASAGKYDDGRGEAEDALTVIAYGRERWPQAALWLAGFSFGAYVALSIAARALPAKLVSVAPPVGRWDFSAVPWPLCPWLILQGDADELVDANAVTTWAQTAPSPPTLVLLPGVGHFFHGVLHQLDAAVLDFLVH